MLQLGLIQCSQAGSSKIRAFAPAPPVPGKAPAGAQSFQGPQFPSGAPGSAIQPRTADASAAAHGPLTPFLPRPAALRQAAASSEGRGRKPLLATGRAARLAARPKSALGAQSRRPVIRRKVPTLGLDQRVGEDYSGRPLWSWLIRRPPCS
ncbi:hypothetical protein NDU88_004368 [Pleurodeles waltl]|uniref:Uncharacterized protein n=1 Tax=Pleurodeles waltl TaxID=8319 RepID=A0AAV7QI70_PLEWA|nr:hypothetical protein NDU88_004368 [Pleurodeles waltl]